MPFPPKLLVPWTFLNTYYSGGIHFQLQKCQYTNLPNRTACSDTTSIQWHQTQKVPTLSGRLAKGPQAAGSDRLADHLHARLHLCGHHAAQLSDILVPQGHGHHPGQPQHILR